VITGDCRKARQGAQPTPTGNRRLPPVFGGGERGFPFVLAQGTCLSPSSPAMDLPELNFNPRRGVQAVILSRFGEHVNFSPNHDFKEFALLVSVGRCKYRLSVPSIGLIL
jgi:hypothetical protein